MTYQQHLLQKIRDGNMVSSHFIGLSDEDLWRWFADETHDETERFLQGHFKHVLRAKNAAPWQVREWLPDNVTGPHGWIGECFGFDDPNDAFHCKMRFG